MAAVYLVTGAAGHLGNTIVAALLRLGEQVRALIMPNQNIPPTLRGAKIYTGNICDKATLAPFFQTQPGDTASVIHCAGIVSIASKFQRIVYDVNVNGTRNILACCKEYAVHKLVHVSSVHAIPELPHGQTMEEIDHFDPDKVVGQYAKTKAEATQLVLDAAQKGLNASVVHPSGICGPNDYGRGHMTQLFKDYYRGALLAAVKGGYDFCDVRDVAQGILACAEHGRAGQCYILSGGFYAVPQLLQYFQEVTGKKPVKTELPIWFAKLTAPLSEAYYRLLKQPPLYTPYSLYTLTSNASFSNETAMRELGYSVRPMRETVLDMM
ncbi:MAG: NAD-dependent epimerase/dehydratase family protein, partial [Clostridia bacterium]|nr:NAD-dependent epimerase/dehydratase family protein [Clostridia bacterium]